VDFLQAGKPDISDIRGFPVSSRRPFGGEQKFCFSITPVPSGNCKCLIRSFRIDIPLKIYLIDTKVSLFYIRAEAAMKHGPGAGSEKGATRNRLFFVLPASIQ